MFPEAKNDKLLMRVRVSLQPASVMHSRQEIGMHCSDWGNQLYAVF